MMSLRQFFTLTVVGFAASLAALFYVVFQGSQKAIVASSTQLAQSASANIAMRTLDHLAVGQRAIDEFERLLGAGLVRAHDPDGIERTLRTQMLAHEELTELTLTWDSAQVSLIRGIDGRLESRRRIKTAAGWGKDKDPTDNPTYTTPTLPRYHGVPLWSDLSFSWIDDALPEAARRKTVSVMKSLYDGQGELVGVFRASLLSDAIDRLAQLRVRQDDPNDPHRIFLCDRHGRLITRLAKDDTFATLDEDGKPDPDGDVRVMAKHVPPAIAAALALPELADLDEGEPITQRRTIDGKTYVITFDALPADRTQDWVVGIVVPESYYLADVLAARNRSLWICAAIMLALLCAGGVSLRTLRRGFALIGGETDRMRAFHFAPSAARSPFRDINVALQGLEQAKTALRAMGRYVPIDLVRQLYESNREPVLGGVATDVSILFSDVEDFTAVSERLEPNALATALGRYLETLTRAISSTRGTVDKFIGDAVMVLWNAPQPVDDHAQKACQAALACVEATRALFASQAWQGLPPWRTRFGLHRDTVTVGHFGAPDRLSYTAMGDGVNLASRLEGLNKQYGTSILVSESIYEAAGEDFLFRRLDRVAVKGRTRGVLVYELCGLAQSSRDRWPLVQRYEAALAAYFDRRFDTALAHLEHILAEDPPSRVLAARCKQMLAAPPPADWDGTFVAKDK